MTLPSEPTTTSSDIIIRASSFGGCDRAILASLYGEPKKPTTAKQQEAFDRGNAAEDKILARIAKENSTKVVDQQLELTHRIQIGDISFALQGHIDGRLDTHSMAIAEAKCLNKQSTEKFLRDPIKYHRKYTFQASIYAYLLQRHYDLPQTPAIIFGIYNWELKKYHVNSYPTFHTWEEIEARLYRIASYFFGHTYPEFCNEYSFFCDYTLCNKEPAPIEPPSELDQLLATYQSLKDQTEIAKQAVLDNVSTRSDFPIRTATHTITQTAASTYQSIDAEKARILLGDKYEEVLVSKTRSASFTIRSKSSGSNIS